VDYFWLENGKPIFVKTILEQNKSLLEKYGEDFADNAPLLIAYVNRAEKELQSPVIRQFHELFHDPIDGAVPSRIDRKLSHSALHVKSGAILSTTKAQSIREKLAKDVANFKIISIDTQGKEKVMTIAEHLGKSEKEIAAEIKAGRIDTRVPVGFAMGVMILAQRWSDHDDIASSCIEHKMLQRAYDETYFQERKLLDQTSELKGDLDQKDRLRSRDSKLRKEISNLQAEYNRVKKAKKTKANQEKLRKLSAEIARKQKQLTNVRSDSDAVKRNIRLEGERIPNFMYSSLRGLRGVMLEDTNIRAARIAAEYPTNIVAAQKQGMLQFWANV